MRRPASSIDPSKLIEELDWVHSLARSLVLDTNEADDLAQDVLLAGLTATKGTKGNLRAWLAKALRYRRSVLRRTGLRRKRREQLADRRTSAPSVAEVMERAEIQRQIVAAVFELREPYRTVVVLRYFENLETEAIAKHMSVRAATVRTRLKRGLDLLRSALDGKFGGRRKWVALLVPWLLFSRGSSASASARPAASTFLLLATPFFLVAVILGVLGGMRSRTLPPPTPQRIARASEARPVRVGTARDRENGPSHRMNDSVELTGVVTDSQGAPIAGALVKSLLRPWRRVELLAPEVESRAFEGPSARTASDGGFALKLRRGDELDLEISAPARARAIFPRRVAGERVTLVLPLPSRIEVSVETSSGLPVADARVRLWRRDEDLKISYDEREGVTSVEGECAFDGAPAGVATLRVTGPSFKDSDLERIEITEGEISSLRVVLQESKEIGGRVLAARTLEPIPGALVQSGFDASRAVLTDKDGRFSVSGLGAATDEICAEAQGFGRECMESSADGDLELLLRPGRELVGIVVDPERRPLEGVLVATVGSGFRDGWQEGDSRTTFTDDEGFFQLSSLRTDLPRVIVVQALGFGRLLASIDMCSSPADITDLGPLQLAPEQHIGGIALDPAGNPLIGVGVRLDGPVLAEPEANPASRVRHGPRGFIGRYGSSEIRRTSSDGRFVFPGLRAGTFSLRLERGSGRESSAVVTLDTEADLDQLVLRQSDEENLAPGDMPLNRDDSPAITGVVLDSSGLPLAAMEVLAVDPGSRSALASTMGDEHGAFRLCTPSEAPVDVLVTGARRVRVLRPLPLVLTPYRGEARAVTAPSRGVEIRARTLSEPSLTVHVVDARGLPLPAARVFVRGLRGSSRRGLVQIPGLPDRSGWSMFGLEDEVVELRALGPWESLETWRRNKVFSNSLEVSPRGQEVTLICEE